MTSAELPEASIPDTHAGILETALMAMVSTIGHKDGLISTNPVAFDWDGEYIRLSTLKSRVKYRNLLANPQITFCALDAEDLSRYIEIRGHAEVSEDPDGSLNRTLFNRMTSEPGGAGPRGRRGAGRPRLRLATRSVRPHAQGFR